MDTQPPATNAQTSRENRGTNGWDALGEMLAAKRGKPFYPLQNVPNGQEVFLEVRSVELDALNFQGRFSLLELDVRDHSGAEWRICVSGASLAAAIHRLRPMVGDTVVIKPTGEPGRERRWEAYRVVPVQQHTLK